MSIWPVSPATDGGLGLDARHEARAHSLLDAYRVKWACIILNDFLPLGSARRAMPTWNITEERAIRHWRELKLNSTKLVNGEGQTKWLTGNSSALIHKSTKRDYLARVTKRDKAEVAKLAIKFDYDYWDGSRQTGYGGYRYDGRWRKVADAMVAAYAIKPGMRVLDVVPARASYCTISPRPARVSRWPVSIFPATRSNTRWTA